MIECPHGPVNPSTFSLVPIDADNMMTKNIVYSNRDKYNRNSNAGEKLPKCLNGVSDKNVVEVDDMRFRGGLEIRPETSFGAKSDRVKAFYTLQK